MWGGLKSRRTCIVRSDGPDLRGHASPVRPRPRRNHGHAVESGILGVVARRLHLRGKSYRLESTLEQIAHLKFSCPLVQISNVELSDLVFITPRTSRHCRSDTSPPMRNHSSFDRMTSSGLVT